MAGYLNGNGSRPEGDSNIASLDEARRRAAMRARQEKRAEGEARFGAMTTRDWIVAGIVILMAFGMLWHWLAPLLGAKGLVR